jgi:transketolase
MRKQFAKMLHEAMGTDSRIFLLTADLGYGILDDIRRDYPDRAINVGSCEQLMIGMAVGLANSGFIPVCYSITPFLLYRPFEMIRNYVNYEKVNIKLAGTGRDKDYSHDGITHWAEDDMTIMKCLPNISLFKPKELTDDVFKYFLFSDKPVYLNLRRF